MLEVVFFFLFFSLDLLNISNECSLSQRAVEIQKSKQFE